MCLNVHHHGPHPVGPRYPVGQRFAQVGFLQRLAFGNRDEGLIAVAQHVEHYEMSGYGTARLLAKRLGYSVAADILQQTLDEEKQTDAGLTEIAENDINWKAEQETEEED